MASLLSASTQAAINAALRDTADTFFTKTIHIIKRGTVQVQTFGEQIKSTDTPVPIKCLLVPSRGFNSSYSTVQETQKGQEEHDGWHIFIWHEHAAAAGLTIDPEVDQCLIDGKAYRIAMFTPSAQFADLGFVMMEFEVHFNTR